MSPSATFRENRRPSFCILRHDSVSTSCKLYDSVQGILSRVVRIRLLRFSLLLALHSRFVIATALLRPAGQSTRACSAPVGIESPAARRERFPFALILSRQQRCRPTDHTLARLRRQRSASQRPASHAGSAGRDARAKREGVRLVARQDSPTARTVQRQGLRDNREHIDRFPARRPQRQTR